MSYDPYIGPRNKARTMREFDNLSKEQREEIAYGILPGLPDLTYQRMASVNHGKDHPQAQGLFCKPLKR